MKGVIVARIRTVKPEFFKHWELFELEEETRLPIRVAFAGIWTICDREGRFKWIPKQLKVDVLPYDNIDFSRVLHALTTRGFIRKYSVNGRDYGVVPGFSDHQVINNREKASILPDPNENNGLTREARVDDALPTRGQSCKEERKGKERKGRERNDASNTRPEDDETEATRSQILAKIRSLKYLQGKKPEDDEMRRTILSGFEAFMKPNEILDTMMKNHFQITDRESLESVMKKYVDKKKLNGQNVYDPLEDF
jgi:hypothetical protein